MPRRCCLLDFFAFVLVENYRCYAIIREINFNGARPIHENVYEIQLVDFVETQIQRLQCGVIHTPVI